MEKDVIKKMEKKVIVKKANQKLVEALQKMQTLSYMDKKAKDIGSSTESWDNVEMIG